MVLPWAERAVGSGVLDASLIVRFHAGGRARTGLTAVVHVVIGIALTEHPRRLEESLRAVPAGRLLLETDESGVPIMELYRRASEVRGIPLDRFMEDMQENIDKVFFKR